MNEKNKRILIATGLYPPDLGGPAIMIKGLARALIEKGFEVRILTYSGQNVDQPDPYPVYRVSQQSVCRYLKFFYLMLKLAVWADLIYVTETYSVGRFACLTQKLLGKKYILRFAGDSAWETAFAKGWARDYIVDFQKGKYSRRIEALKKRQKKIMRGAVKVITVSRFLASIAEQIGVSRDKIRVIYNSVDFPEESVSEDGVRKIKSQYGNGAKIILTSCRLNPWKGVDDIIKIIPALQTKVGPVNLLVVGEGPELGNWENLAKDLNIVSLVHFLGRMSHQEVMNYFTAANLFILNTHYEGFSHALLDAMKAGVPIVTTEAGGNPELIENGKEGLFVEYKNQSELLKAATRILTDKGLADRLSAAAREKQKKFTWESVVEGTTRVLKESLHE